VITSKRNERLTLVRRLAQRKHREETGLFVVEGEDLVAAAAAEGIQPVESLVAGENVRSDVLASVSMLPHPSRSIAVYRRADLSRDARDVCLALWRVSDPGNVGTLIRTADAFAASVALSEGCADPTGPKAVRASAGAIFRVPLLRWEEAPVRRIALVAHGGGPLHEASLEPPLTLMLGAEREGLPAELVADCYKATIPLRPGAESLNVAAAGAIALYELARRRPRSEAGS
jgi:TrmH family RNA methyltransferase